MAFFLPTPLARYAPISVKHLARVALPPSIALMGALTGSEPAMPLATALACYGTMILSCLAFPRRHSAEIGGLMALGVTLLAFLPEVGALSWLSALAGIAMAMAPMRVMRARRSMTRRHYAAPAKADARTKPRATRTAISPIPLLASPSGELRG